MPTSSHALFLASRLEKEGLRLGEAVVSPDFSICHWEDVGRDGLSESTDPWQALEVARYDDAGRYRPLKSARNLRHGWRLKLSGSSEVLTALDFLYPGAIGMAVALLAGKILPTTLRATLERQTGMYAVVKKLTTEQAREVIDDLCCGSTPCLRRKLWSVDPGGSALDMVDRAAGHELPLVCTEACNLFVAAGRKVVKGERSPEAE